MVGVALGLAGAAAIAALSPSLEATVSSTARARVPASSPGQGPFGQGSVEDAAIEVALGAPVSIRLILAAVGLAVLGGLVAGAVGSCEPRDFDP